MGKFFKENFIFRDQLSAFGAKNTPKSGPFKVKNNAQTLHKKLQNNLEKVHKTTFFTPKMAKTSFYFILDLPSTTSVWKRSLYLAAEVTKEQKQYSRDRKGLSEIRNDIFSK